MRYLFVSLTALFLILNMAACGQDPIGASEDIAADVVGDNFDKQGGGGEEKGLPAAAGKDLFLQHCASCHHSDKTDKKVGPGLKGIKDRRDEAFILDIIKKGKNAMPPFSAKLNDSEIADLVAHLKTF